MEKMYNPESVDNYFRNNEAAIYWVDNGSASFVWNQPKKSPTAFNKFTWADYVSSDFNNVSVLISEK